MNLIHRLIKIRRPYFLSLMFTAIYLVTLPFFLMFPIDSTEGPKEISFKFFLMAVILGPLFETFFFQHLVVHIYKILKVKSYLIISITSALAFAYFHSFKDLPEFFMFFFAGLVLVLCYLLSVKREENAPFLNTFIIHSLKNLISVLFIGFVWDQFN